MIEKIYLDMDGVLCDFESRYEKLFGELPAYSREMKEWSANWNVFVETEQFKTLDWNPGGKTLLKVITDADIDYEILSSSGGKKHHEKVEAQKKHWLQTNGILVKANIVPGRTNKAKFANSRTVLIDDTPDVIDAFNSAGGYGILHKNTPDTVKKLERILNVAK